MQPRILLLSKDASDLEHLQHVFYDEGIYSQCDDMEITDVKSLLEENNINVILLDESCFSLLSELNSIAKDTSVIILLHHQNEDTIKISMDYNVDDFLMKPRYYNLLPTIYNALEKRSQTYE
ncbi:response regulator transcription factor [Thalassobacillus devorans]|uniref:response regulator transcription factor n=1 Tax=Thalassobacillus devorans TaxID=279813 RepID=UPI000490906A|nr:response regulator transcription factor [Thalassobacillus devorans]